MDSSLVHTVHLDIPALPEFARCVRMTAASLAVCCEIDLEGIEDLRMIAEEVFVYACATGVDEVSLDFELHPRGMSLQARLGTFSPEATECDLIYALLTALCTSVSHDETGRILRVEKYQEAQEC